MDPDPDPRIHASDLDPDSDPDPAIFVIDLQNGNNKKLFFCLLLFEGTFTSFSKIKVKKSHKTLGIKVFLTIFA